MGLRDKQREKERGRVWEEEGSYSSFLLVDCNGNDVFL